jgi:hypothetical protein
MDGGYAVVGIISSFGAGWDDVYVVKLDANGNLDNCPEGCQVSSGGKSGSGGNVSSGGNIKNVTSYTFKGGNLGSGGIKTNTCSMRKKTTKEK